MEFLRKTRFVFNPQEGQIEWWRKPIMNGVILPIFYQYECVPFVRLRVGSKLVDCALDTGYMGGIKLPKSLYAENEMASESSEIIINADRKAGFIAQVPKIDANGGSWKDAKVSFSSDAMTGTIGEDVFSIGQVYFDFLNDEITLSQKSDGSLPLRSEVSRAIPILWDRTQPSDPKLIVIAVKKTIMESAGFKIDDQILQIDGLKHDQLSLAYIKRILDDEKPHNWVILRQGEEIRIASHKIRGNP